MIRPEFKFQVLNQLGIAACNKIREDCSTLLTEVEKLVPASRERSLFVTKLQEACRWAVTAAAQHPDHQAVE